MVGYQGHKHLFRLSIKQCEKAHCETLVESPSQTIVWCNGIHIAQNSGQGTKTEVRYFIRSIDQSFLFCQSLGVEIETRDVICCLVILAATITEISLNDVEQIFDILVWAGNINFGESGANSNW
ncbi:hypothetical protein SNK03_008616 [Fusarium graminearum]